MNLSNIEPIVNRVKKSPLKTIDLSEFVPKRAIEAVDLKYFLFQGLLLKEKEFRQSIRELDTKPFKDKYVAVFCSADAIVPTWAYMLVISVIQPVAQEVMVGSTEDFQKELIRRAIAVFPAQDYENGKVVIKGCADILDPDFAFGEITKLLIPYVASLMYGEPCSTVPIYKRNK